MPDNIATPSSPLPKPQLEFEGDILKLLEQKVAELPLGIATFYVSTVPDHPEWPRPYFEIIPENPRSASISGIAALGDLYLTIGNVEREFVGFQRGSNIVKGATWQEEISWILEAVVRGGFSQRQSLDSKERVIGGASKIMINGREWLFRGGTRFEKLFSKPKYRTVVYEPYY